MTSAPPSSTRKTIALLPLLVALAGPSAPHLAAQGHSRHHATHHAAEAPASTIRNLFWEPNELHQGSPAFFSVELESPATHVSATWIGKTLTFFRDPTNPKLWHALAGDDLGTQPGNYDLVLSATIPGRGLAHLTKSITVAPGDFKTGEITVPENYVNPNEAEQKQIAGDEVLKKRAWDHHTPHPLWSGDFVKPIPAPSTPSFGESRILNEEHTSLHTGTDFPTKEGTPVVVSNSGTVVLTRDLFYEGNCVIIDHGQDLFTIYMHLSRIDVHEGDHLDKGARLGLSGASGRVTGPHVHFGVRWNGGWVDPVQLLALTLPNLQSPHASHAGHASRATHTITRHHRR